MTWAKETLTWGMQKGRLSGEGGGCKKTPQNKKWHRSTTPFTTQCQRSTDRLPETQHVLQIK
jgi:hypothetical protein